MVTSREKKAMKDEALKEVRVYVQVLKDMAKYAESQKKEISDQKRETISPERLQPSGLAGGGRRD